MAEEVETDATVADQPELELGQAEAETIENKGAESEDQVTKEEVKPSDSSPEKEQKDSVQERIDELTAKFRDQERENARLRAEMAKTPPPEPDIKLDTKSLADFDYDEAAFQSHIVEQAKAEALRVVQESNQYQSSNAARASFLEREAKYAEENPEYYGVTRNPSLTITGDMVDVAMESEDGPAVLMHLGKYPEVASRLATLSPIGLAREIGKIEAKISASAQGSKVSNAPSPVPKIEAAAAVTSINPASPESDKLTTKEWLKRREKQLEKANG